MVAVRLRYSSGGDSDDDNDDDDRESSVGGGIRVDFFQNRGWMTRRKERKIWEILSIEASLHLGGADGFPCLTEVVFQAVACEKSQWTIVRGFLAYSRVIEATDPDPKESRILSSFIELYRYTVDKKRTRLYDTRVCLQLHDL